MKTDIVVIVDPFSSGRFLAEEFKEQSGVELVAVISSDQLARFYYETFQASDFQDVIRFAAMDDLWSKLERYNVKAVLPGSEPGVLLAHIIARHFGLERNSDEEAGARRNKYLMIERIRDFGLPCLQQITSSEISQARQLASEHLQYPLVCKPLDSAGTEGVSICHSDNDLELQFKRLIGSMNVTGSIIDKLLLQELAIGPEYVVDTVRLEGTTVLTGIWRYRKTERNNSSFVYDTMSLLSKLSEEESALINYTLSCLDALGIKIGPSHSEVIQTDKGPRLIETGSRIHGGNGTIISGKCLGYNQIDLTVSIYTDKNKFRLVQQRRYLPQKIAQEVFLISEKDGIFKGLSNLDQVRSLKTFDFMTWNISVGTPIAKTVDLLSSPGRVVLIGEPDDIARDYESIRRWELSAYEIA